MRELLSCLEAAEMMCVSPRQFWHLKRDGVGPKAVSLGGRRIAYRPEDIREWIAGRIMQPNEISQRAKSPRSRAVQLAD
jgi:predicted DNA-binding transcriptional regulator AlpA